MDQVQGEDVDTASHGGQSADDGGEDAEAACTEQKVLRRKIQPGRDCERDRSNGANESQFKAMSQLFRFSARKEYIIHTVYNTPYSAKYTSPFFSPKSNINHICQ